MITSGGATTRFSVASMLNDWNAANSASERRRTCSRFRLVEGCIGEGWSGGDSTPDKVKRSRRTNDLEWL